MGALDGFAVELMDRRILSHDGNPVRAVTILETGEVWAAEYLDQQCGHLLPGRHRICPAPPPTPPLLRASRPPDAFQAFVEAQPIGRLGRSAEIAAAALFLASDEAPFVTGVAFPVDGGQSASP